MEPAPIINDRYFRDANQGEAKAGGAETRLLVVTSIRGINPERSVVHGGSDLNNGENTLADAALVDS